MPLTAAAAAAKILDTALNLFKSAREQAKVSKDTDLKETISSLFDVVLDLKQAVLLVTEENNQLRAEREKSTEQPKRKQVGEAIYYFVGDEGPFCQPCYDDKKKLVALTPAEPWSGGIRRQCLVCHHFFHEKPMNLNPIRLGGRRSPWG
jgi:hypothetical protein